MMDIMIVSNLGDQVAYLVQEGLLHKGACAKIIHTSDYPTRLAISFSVDSNQFTKPILSDTEMEIHKDYPKTIWWRRPTGPVLPEWVEPEDQDFAMLECKEFMNYFWSFLDSQEVFWINPYDASLRAQRKTLQQQAACKLGLTVPATLYSNDPKEIHKFFEEHNGRLVYKPYRPFHASWQENGGKQILYTSLIPEITIPMTIHFVRHPEYFSLSSRRIMN